MHDRRRVAFEGPVNFRDIGGYASSFGGVVRWRTVYRSDGLHHLTPGDVEAFRTLGIASVFDLRGDPERDEFPDPVDLATFHALELPTSPELGSGARARWIDATDRATGEAVMVDHYRSYLDHGAPAIGRLLRALAADDHHPAVVHCMAGKDRTGVAIAVLLLALGVDRGDVIEDYALSATYRTIEVEAPFVAYLQEQGLAFAAIEALLDSPPHRLEGALAHVDDTYGSIDDFVLGPCGLSPGELAQLREALLDDAR